MASSQQVHNLEDLLDRLGKGTDGDTITLEEVRDAIGHRAYGPLLLAIGGINISPIGMIPGIWWFTATIALIVAFQLLISANEPWMPKGLLEHSFSRDRLEKTQDALRPWARRIDRFIKPRWQVLTRAPMLQVVALIAMAMAILTYPLSMIWGAGFFPGMALLLIGLGLTARDGVVLTTGGAFAGLTVAIVVVVVPTVIRFFSNLAGRLDGALRMIIDYIPTFGPVASPW